MELFNSLPKVKKIEIPNQIKNIGVVVNDIKKNILTNEPLKEALEALKPDDNTNVVERDRTITFEPRDKKAEKGLILYPGGLVDVRSYGAIAKAISQQGYKVVLLKIPMAGIAVAPRRGKLAFDENPEIKEWVVAAHSQGGLSAGMFAGDNLDRVRGLALWGSFPINNLSDKNLKAITIVGTKDGVISEVAHKDSLNKLPKDTQNIIIEGGNHANFGHYGHQLGDKPSTISREEQQKITVQKTVELLKSI